MALYEIVERGPVADDALLLQFFEANEEARAFSVFVGMKARVKVGHRSHHLLFGGNLFRREAWGGEQQSVTIKTVSHAPSFSYARCPACTERRTIIQLIRREDAVAILSPTSRGTGR